MFYTEPCATGTRPGSTVTQEPHLTGRVSPRVCLTGRRCLATGQTPLVQRLAGAASLTTTQADSFPLSSKLRHTLPPAGHQPTAWLSSVTQTTTTAVQVFTRHFDEAPGQTQYIRPIALDCFHKRLLCWLTMHIGPQPYACSALIQTPANYAVLISHVVVHKINFSESTSQYKNSQSA